MKSRGFTLVELLIVIAIIGLLSTLSVVAFTNAKEKSRIAAGQYLAKSILDGIGENAVGVWGLDECAGAVAHDSSGQSHDGTVDYVSSPGWSTDTPLKVGCSIYLDGANNYIDTSYSWTLRNNNFTISLWFKATSSQSGVILSQLTTPILLQATNGYIVTCLTGTCEGGEKKYNDGKWHLAVVTGNDSYLKIFIDNLTTPYLSLPNNSDTVSGYLAIGHLYYGGWNYTGLIDDVRVYQASMSTQ